MQIIVQNVNILPRSYWTKARNLFRYIQYKCVPKIRKKKSSNEDSDCITQDVLSYTTVNKLHLTYHKVCDLTSLCLEPFWETGEN
jgi:hypothetical protein